MLQKVPSTPSISVQASDLCRVLRPPGAAVPHLLRQDHEGPREPGAAQHQGRHDGPPGHQDGHQRGRLKRVPAATAAAGATEASRHQPDPVRAGQRGGIARYLV